MIETFTIPEVSERTGIPKATLYKAIRDGSLKARKLRGAKKGWRVSAQEIEEFWERGLEHA